MRVEGTAAYGGPAHGGGIPVPTTARPIGPARRQGWTIPLLNERPVYTPVLVAKPKPRPTRNAPIAKIESGSMRLTPDQRQEIIDRYNAGQNRNQIRLAMGIPRSTVDRWAGRASSQPKPTRP
jgi:DNA-directed RNA polymerase specialized sigma24 family protein